MADHYQDPFKLEASLSFPSLTAAPITTYQLTNASCYGNEKSELGLKAFSENS